MSGAASGAETIGLEQRYLDAAATAQLRPEALAAMLEVFTEGQANASSVHQAGHRARSRVEHARGQIAAAFGARPADVVFTSGGTEANVLAVQGLALARPRGRHIVTSPLEHPSVLETCRFLERVFGFDITVLPVDGRGLISLGDVERALRADTTLVSIGLASAEVGTVQRVAEIGEIAHRAGALMHTDAVQAAAALPVTFAAETGEAAQNPSWPGLSVDAMTIASHKFGGPQGVGALLVRRHLAIEPVLHGGGQERGLRSGTENVAGIAGFAAAVVASTSTIGQHALALLECRELLVERVISSVPGAALTGHPDERLPGHASFTVAGVSGEALLVALDAAGYAVSSGSACAAGSDEPSPALLAMGVDPVLAQTAIRLTLADPIDEPAVDRLTHLLRTEAQAMQLPGLVHPGYVVAPSACLSGSADETRASTAATRASSGA